MSIPINLPDPRSFLPRGAAYFLAAAVIGLALFASGTPSPLYATYAEIWHFSSLVLTLVYATYAFVGLTNGVASCVGMATGVLTSAALVEYLPAPRVLPYVLLMVLFLVALAFAWRLREPVAVAPGARARLTPARPYVPPVARRPFLL